MASFTTHDGGYLIELQEPFRNASGRSATYDWLIEPGQGVSPRLRTRHRLRDNQDQPRLTEEHARLQFVDPVGSRHQFRLEANGTRVYDRSVFEIIPNVDAWTAQANELPNPKLAYHYNLASVIPPIRLRTDGELQTTPAELLHHLTAQIVNNLILTDPRIAAAVADGQPVDLVLTVPNIYSPIHRQDLEAMVRAATPVRSVRSVSESDAVILYVASKPQWAVGESAVPYTRYVTIDVGKGTVDTSAIETKPSTGRARYTVEALAHGGSSQGGGSVTHLFAEYFAKRMQEALPELTAEFASHVPLEENVLAPESPVRTVRDVIQNPYALTPLQTLPIDFFRRPPARVLQDAQRYHEAVTALHELAELAKRQMDGEGNLTVGFARLDQPTSWTTCAMRAAVERLVRPFVGEPSQDGEAARPGLWAIALTMPVQELVSQNAVFAFSSVTTATKISPEHVQDALHPALATLGRDLMARLCEPWQEADLPQLEAESPLRKLGLRLLNRGRESEPPPPPRNGHESYAWLRERVNDYVVTNTSDVLQELALQVASDPVTSAIGRDSMSPERSLEILRGDGALILVVAGQGAQFAPLREKFTEIQRSARRILTAFRYLAGPEAKTACAEGAVHAASPALEWLHPNRLPGRYLLRPTTPAMMAGDAPPEIPIDSNLEPGKAVFVRVPFPDTYQLIYQVAPPLANSKTVAPREAALHSVTVEDAEDEIRIAIDQMDAGGFALTVNHRRVETRSTADVDGSTSGAGRSNHRDRQRVLYPKLWPGFIPAAED